jgi:hypothetical protein
MRLRNVVAVATGSRYSANNPSEDRVVVSPGVPGKASSAPEGVGVASVLDGHAGWQVRYTSDRRPPPRFILSTGLCALAGRSKGGLQEG